MYREETLNKIALSYLGRYNVMAIADLYKEVGNATNIISNYKSIRDVIKTATPKLIKLLSSVPNAIEVAKREMDYCEKKGITICCINNENYPKLMAECNDAPLVLFFKGNVNLNQKHIINIVGTRNCTSYGKDLITRFIKDLSIMCPKTLVVSGLAYGVDVCAHRAAIENNMNTLGVLAHGLDMLYPAVHRELVNEMTEKGGILTEYCTQTKLDKMNFVQRNRIVAGVSEATILVESAEKGGGLITLGIANAYNRDCFAFPGRVGDVYSEGCNYAIKSNKAALITSADDLIKMMGWSITNSVAQQQTFNFGENVFENLSPEAEKIIEVLKQNNDLQINILLVKSNIPMGKLTAALFELEMSGIVRPLAGGVYHLIK